MVSKKSKLESVAKTTVSCVQNIIEQKYHLDLSSETESKEKEIIEYNSRMRADGLEKFNGPCYVAAVNFFPHAAAQKTQDATGAMILYAEKEALEKFLRTQGHKQIDMEDDAAILEKCGNICQTIADQLRNDLKTLLNHDYVLSPPIKGKNEIVAGVDFKYDEHYYYEIAFYLWKGKAFVIDITLA